MPGARRMLIQAARFAWLALALIFIVWFIASRWEEAAGYLSALSLWQPIAAFALLAVGKLVYVEVIRRSLNAVDAQGGWKLAFSSYGLSSLGKYIPGSVWQFVGRFEIYRSSGVGSAHAVGLIFLENVVMLVMASLVGLIAAPVFVNMALEYVPLPVIAGLGALALTGAGVAAFVVRPIRSRIAQLASAVRRHRWLIATMAALFITMWTLMGLSALVLIAGDVSRPDIAVFVIGLFALSYVVGFIAIFAPAGVGVREAVFTIGLAGIMPVDAALVIAVGHRLIYVVSDVALGALAWFLYSRPSVHAKDA